MNSGRLLKLGRSGLLACAAWCLWLAPESASAGLNFDLRVSGGKIAYVTAVGQVVTMDLYAQVTGAAGNGLPEGFQETFGSVLSSAGGNISGKISSGFVSPFTDASDQAGKQQDLDADGDLDLGSNLTAHNADFFYVRSGGMTVSGTPIQDGTEFKIATFSFLVQSISNLFDFTPINVNFRLPVFSNGVDIEAVWQQDGNGMNSNGVGGGTFPTVSSPVLIQVPEPSTAGLLGVAALALVARPRRSGAAQSSAV